MSDDDALFLAEIKRDWRQRIPGAWVCVVMAALLSIGVFYSMPMMHGSSDYSVADGTIVAVERDPQSGELEMTSEFVDAAGVRHRDVQTEGYHYAKGEPEVGQSIEYLYRASPLTGDLQAFPRGDRILQLVFGLPALFLLLVTAILVGFLQRKRNFRRRLLREGRREPGQMLAIAHRSISIPVGAAAGQPIDMWRLEARYFEASAGAFVDCHSDWMPAPAPESIEGVNLPPILVDPNNPERYWLPVGALARRQNATAQGVS